MKILHVAPLWFPVAPDAAGGRETFLAGLLRALSELGCENTVLASGDSRVDARLVAVVEKNLLELMQAGRAAEYGFYESALLRWAVTHAAEFDLIHSHIGERGFMLSGLPGRQAHVLHTWHTPAWTDLEWYVRRHPDDWYSTVSEFQARRFRAAGARHCHVIPNGIAMATFTPTRSAGDGLVFLGRLDWSKGADIAIRVAQQLGRPLELAGPITDQQFFETHIRPQLSERIRYLGTVNHAQRNALLGRAACAVLPFRGAESFGLVTVEAMACGTPVVALANGALPEIIEPGVTGYLAEREEELPALVERAVQLDRAVVRQRAAARFDLPAVARQYRELYEQMRRLG